MSETMKKIPGEAHAAFGMSILLTTGGVFAYVSKRSIPSLVGSLAFASAYAFSGNEIRLGRERQGHLYATGTAFCLSGMMLQRFVKTYKFFPAGFAMGLGVLSGAYHAYKYSLWSE